MGVHFKAPKTEHRVQNRPFWGSFDPIQTTFSYGGPQIRTLEISGDPKSEDPELFGTPNLRTPSSSRPQISGSRALRDPESTQFDPSDLISDPLPLDLDPETPAGKAMKPEGHPRDLYRGLEGMGILHLYRLTGTASASETTA